MLSTSKLEEEAIRIAESAKAELARRHLYDFMKLHWKHMEPEAPFRDNWHVGAVCDHLEAVERGHIHKLVINVPPGFAKSLSVCVSFPAWVWTRRPTWQAIFTSYADGLSRRDSVRTRNVIESPTYQGLIWDFKLQRPKWTLPIANENLLWNSLGGKRHATSVGVRVRANARTASWGMTCSKRLMCSPMRSASAPSSIGSLRCRAA